MEKEIEIPEGYEARIEGNKVIFEREESEDERIRKFIVETIFRYYGDSQEYLDTIAYLKKQKEQKPARIIVSGEEILRGNSKLYVQNLADRIESLRPQPHWKPSKEQIGALERAIVKMHTPNDIDILAKLRDNLKKL